MTNVSVIGATSVTGADTNDREVVIAIADVRIVTVDLVVVYDHTAMDELIFEEPMIVIIKGLILVSMNVQKIEAGPGTKRLQGGNEEVQE
mmetsp:Transcript_34635/g.42716  ORF Transcript_34635/g.42716 Transcript_34635/m.42716 type:complete len:90 (-) Transcript_34635:1337-1606(-)